MDTRTLDFLIFAVFSVCCLAGGYASREKGWVQEETSRFLHLITISVLWALMALMAIWRLPPLASSIWILIIEPTLVLLPAVVVTLICRRLGYSAGESVLLGIGAGLANRGFTLGAYFCYAMLGNPEHAPPGIDPTDANAAQATAEAAFAYAVAGVNVMAVCGIIFLYPLARRFGPEGGRGEPIGKLIFHSLVSFRAMIFYTSIIALLLAVLQVPYPDVLAEGSLMRVLLYVSAFGAYFGVGLRLHFNRHVFRFGPHLVLAIAQFVVTPLLTFGLLWTAHQTQTPPTSLLDRVFIIEAFMPTAIQMVMIANLFRLDSRLASGLFVVNTALFLLIPMPILLWWSAG
ncbi:AEC family transporter [Mucisphaera sp.]|uniref:AEC family transporter n=1 Tax=Mucisphaera sp. TaxID=2913024 RepID=UPI003D12447F